MKNIEYIDYINFIEKIPKKLWKEMSNDPFRTMYIFIKVVYGYEIKGVEKYTKYYNDLMIIENNITK